MTIHWSNETKVEPADLQIIRQAIESVLETERLFQDGEVSVSLLSAEAVHELNLRFRQVDRTTDVLSFPQYGSLEEILNTPYMFLGDIVINLDKVEEQAIEYGHSKRRELGYLTIHSMYHLLGFDHMEETEKREMREREEQAFLHLEEK